jgi:NADH:ubiquinone oxidoreductase subunit 2 (subunit N)
MFMKDPEEELEQNDGRSIDLSLGLGLAAVAVVALGVFPEPVLEAAQDAVRGMLGF